MKHERIKWYKVQLSFPKVVSEELLFTWVNLLAFGKKWVRFVVGVEDQPCFYVAGLSKSRISFLRMFDTEAMVSLVRSHEILTFTPGKILQQGHTPRILVGRILTRSKLSSTNHRKVTQREDPSQFSASDDEFDRIFDSEKEVELHFLHAFVVPRKKVCS
jgi:hypothetical protein